MTDWWLVAGCVVAVRAPRAVPAAEHRRRSEALARAVHPAGVDR